MRLVSVLTILPFVLAGQAPGGRGGVGVNPTSPGTAAPQETKPEDLCTIEGQVLNAVTGEPLKKATLTLMPTDLPQNNTLPPNNYVTSTDAGGRFAMKGLEPGKYRFRVTRLGFVAMEYGARAPSRPGTILSLDRGAHPKDVNFRLTPHAVITGRVTDEDGDPVAGVQVQLARMGYSQGQRRLSYTNTNATDDRGEYRIYGIAPGKYYLSVTYRSMMAPMNAVDRSAAPQPEEDYVPTYYPGTINAADAAQIEIAAGREVGNLSMKLSKAHTVRLRGHVSQGLVNGHPTITIFLVSRNTNSMAMYLMNRSRTADAKGNFELAGVAPGPYELRANLHAGDKNYSAKVAVDVGSSNIDNIGIAIEAGLTLKGQVRVDGTTNQSLTDLSFRLLPREMGAMIFNSAMGRLNDDATFVLDNVSPDAYRLSITGLPDGFYLKRVQLGDAESPGDTLDVSAGVAQPVTVVLSPNAGQIIGTVQNPTTQQPAPGAVVALIPQEPERQGQNFFYKQTAADQFGSFTFRNVIPGEYKVFAWEDLEPGAYFDPEFMKPIEAKGERLTVSESGKPTVQATLIPADSIAAPAGQ